MEATASNEFRRDAELRAKALHEQKDRKRQAEFSRKLQVIHQGLPTLPPSDSLTQSPIKVPMLQSNLSPDRRQSILFMDAADTSRNTTPNDARLFEKDYQLNGSRARCDSGEFIPPRWILDQEVVGCNYCNSVFDFVNRKHHCRYVHVLNLSCIQMYVSLLLFFSH